MTTTARGLLRRLDDLPVRERDRLVATTARELAGTGATLDGFLAELDGQGPLGSRTALELARVARHTGHLSACLAGDDPSLRARAVAVAVALGLPAELFTRLLPDWPAATREGLYRAVRRRRRTDLADALLPAVRDRCGDREAAALLPACSPAVVAGALPELEHAVRAWSALAHRHPAAFLAFLNAELSAAPRAAWAGVCSRTGTALAVAAGHDPGGVLALLERAAPDVDPVAAVGDGVAALLRHSPSRTVGLLLDPRGSGRVPDRPAVWRALRAADDAELAALARVCVAGAQLSLRRLLRALPPSRRAAVYAGAIGGRDLIHAGLATDILDELPVADRAAEAARLLRQRRVADHPVTRLAVTARLAWADARPELSTAIRRATAIERAQAYPLYIGAAAGTRDPSAVAELLTDLDRLTNEQDPVRQAALSALATLPPRLLTDDGVATLAGLAGDATRARDCSAGTRAAVRALADNLIRHGAQAGRDPMLRAGLDVLELLGALQAQVNLSGVDRGLPRGAELAVLRALRPRIDADARRGRFGVALALAAGLGRRYWLLPELQEIVGRARTAADDQVIRRAIELWLAPPAGRDERVAQVLRDDRSAITIYPVQRAISLHRTDLLDSVLGGRLHGRFLRRGVRYVPEFFDGVRRWLPRQVQAYADLLAGIAGSASAPVFERTVATLRLGRLPGSARRLRALLADPQVPVVEAALQALARTDRPADVLPDLLSYVDGDRARVAVYAVGRCARFVPPPELARRLGPLLAAPKVTARKEAVRLLARFGVPGAAGALAAAWDAPGQHRDVRRAVVSAARWLPDAPELVTVLERAAGAERAIALALLDVTPGTVPGRLRGRYARLMRTVAGSADPDTALAGLRALPPWSRWDPDATALLARHVTELSSTATWRAAVQPLIIACRFAQDGAPVLDAAATLLAADTGGDPAPQGGGDPAPQGGGDPAPPGGRDRPARQRLLALLGAVATEAPDDPVTRDTARQLAEWAATLPSYGSRRVELAEAALDRDRPDADLPGLLRLAELADRPALAAHAGERLGRTLGRLASRLPREALLAAARALAAQGPSGAALALAVAGVAGPQAGWAAPWRAVLAGLREHPDPDVREAALSVFTSRE